MKMCDRPDDKYLISWPSMTLKMRNYPLELWISSSTAHTFHGVVIVQVHKTTFGILFCLSHK